MMICLFCLFVCLLFCFCFLGGWVWVGLLLGFYFGGLLGFLFFGGGVGGCWSVWGELQLLGLRLLENILYFIGHVI